MNFALEVSKSNLHLDLVQQSATVYLKPEQYAIESDIALLRKDYGNILPIAELQPYTEFWSCMLSERNAMYMREAIASTQPVDELSPFATEEQITEALALGYAERDPTKSIRERVQILGGLLLNEPITTENDTFEEDQVFRNAERRVLRVKVCFDDLLHEDPLPEEYRSALQNSYRLSNGILTRMHEDVLHDAQELFAGENIHFRLFTDWFINLEPIQQDLLLQNANHICEQVAKYSMYGIHPSFFATLVELAQTLEEEAEETEETDEEDTTELTERPWLGMYESAFSKCIQ